MNSIVNNIYIVNMKKDVDRLNRFKKICDSEFKYQIIEGVDVETKMYKDIYIKWKNNNIFNIDENNFNWKYYTNRYDDLKNITTKQQAWNHYINFGKKELRSFNPICDIVNKGQLGCLLSHINILKDAIKNKYESILVLEDDIILTSHYNEKTLYNLKSYTKNNEWKLIYLGAGQHCWNNIEYIENFYFAKKSTGTFAYMIHHTFYHILLEQFEKMKKPVDNYLVDIQSSYYKQILVLFPNIIVCNLENSNIGQMRKNDIWFKKFKWIL